MSRRRFQRGSLKDEGDRWVIRWRTDSIDPETGEHTRPYKWDILSKKQFPTKRLAERELSARVAEVNSESYKPLVSGMTFSRFAAAWQKQVMCHHELSTQVSEKSHIKIHLNPAFGGIELRHITAPDLQEWVSKQTLSAKTVKNVISTLHAMWETAKAWEYVNHDPFKGLRLPKKVKPNTYSFSIEETLAIIHKAQEPWKTLFWIVAETGIRSGEVAGLRVMDFDTVNLTLAIRQSVWNGKIKAPKSENGFRREPVSPELAEAIKTLTADKLQSELMFTGSTGKPLDMIHFINRTFRPILEELGIWEKAKAMGVKQCGLHALRRMNGTQMDVQGVPLKTRQERMGHAHPSTTLYHYTKPIDEASRQFSARMGAMLSPDDGKLQ